LIPLEVQDHSVPQRKPLRCGKFEARGLSCGSFFNIGQDILKSANSIHKQGFVNSQVQTIANRKKDSSMTNVSLKSFSKSFGCKTFKKIKKISLSSVKLRIRSMMQLQK